MTRNSLKQYCKNELTKDGSILAFFDTSAISELIKKSELIEETIIVLKKNKIRPVVNYDVLAECIKGLYKKGKPIANFYECYKKKIEIMIFLDEMKCLFLLYHEEIESIELKNLQKIFKYNLNSPDKPECLKVFRTTPFKTNPLNIKSSYVDYLIELIYTQGQEISRISEEDLNEHIDGLHELRNLSKYFCKKCKNITQNKMTDSRIETRLQRGIIDPNKLKRIIKLKSQIIERDLYECFCEKDKDLWRAFSTKINLTKDSSKEDKESLQILLRKPINKQSKLSNVKYSKKIKNISKEKDKFYYFCPLFSILNYAFWECESKRGKKGVNDFLDNLYFANAMSYCDIFISNDTNINAIEKIKKDFADLKDFPCVNVNKKEDSELYQNEATVFIEKLVHISSLKIT